jgi:hypothetical protein
MSVKQKDLAQELQKLINTFSEMTGVSTVHVVVTYNDGKNWRFVHGGVGDAFARATAMRAALESFEQCGGQS